MQESQECFDKIQADVLQWYHKGHRVVVMGDFNVYIGLGELGRNPKSEWEEASEYGFAASLAIVNE